MTRSNLSIEAKRKRLAEFEIHEVWPQMGIIEGEEGWRSDEEIREYFQELPEWELECVWDETFGWEPYEDE